MEVFDKDGNPIENVFSQEELDAKLKEAKEAADAEVAKAKTDADVEVAKNKTPETQKPDEVLATLKELQETVSGLVKTTETSGASKFTSSLDEEKKTVFNEKFEALQKTGAYENTPEGIEKRASDAYTLTTGTAFDFNNFNMGNLSAVSGKSPVKSNVQQSEVDKILSEVLGNTEDDIKKYGGNTTT